MTTWRRGLAALLLLGATVLGTAGASSAQETPVAPGLETAPPAPGQVVQSWALSPAGATDPDQPGNRPNLTYDLPPGASVDDAVTVANYGNVPLELRIYASDAVNNADGGFDLLRPDETASDVGSWVSIPQPSLIVQPRTQYTIPVTITVPADATPGDHVGGIVAGLRAKGTGADGKVVDLEQRTGTRLYLRVDGPLQPNLSVENVQTRYSSKLNPLSGPTEVTYTIANRGNVRMGGTAKVKVGGPFGLFATTTEPEQIPELLPGESVQFTKTLDGQPATVVQQAEVIVEPREIVNPSEQAPQSTSGTALGLALPVTVIVLLVVAGLLLYARHRYVQRKHPTPPPGGPYGGGRPPAPMPAPPAAPAPDQRVLT